MATIWSHVVRTMNPIGYPLPASKAMQIILAGPIAMTWPDAMGIPFTWPVGPITPQRTCMPLEITITTAQKVKVTSAPVSRDGQPAQLDGPLIWQVQSGTATVQVIDDRSAYLFADVVGEVVLKVAGDSNLSDSIKIIEDQVILHVIDVQAEKLGLSAGDAAPGGAPQAGVRTVGGPKMGCRVEQGQRTAP
jgi:hypothetical protein